MVVVDTFMNTSKSVRIRAGEIRREKPNQTKTKNRSKSVRIRAGKIRREKPNQTKTKNNKKDQMTAAKIKRPTQYKYWMSRQGNPHPNAMACTELPPLITAWIANCRD